MYLGDNFLVGGLTEMVKNFLLTRPDAEVIAVAEKPDRPRSNLVMMGIYLFTLVIHDAVRSMKGMRSGASPGAQAQSVALVTASGVVVADVTTPG